MKSLPNSAQLKINLMFQGIRYSQSLGEAALHSFPNYYPYRFQPGEHRPDGKATADIPYLMKMADGTEVRVKGNGSSPWVVRGDREAGYSLSGDGQEDWPVSFEPLPEWMRGKTSDGSQMAQAGVSLHGDMAVVNVAPGCQYFLAKGDSGGSLRCTFCTYGAPDTRIQQLEQGMSQVGVPPRTYERMKETLAAVVAESAIRHIYLVGGSLTDWQHEGERFIELARQVRSAVPDTLPVTCGSGALPEACLHQLHDEALVQNVCFNLEIWSEPLFAKICPGKQRFVGYERWIDSLEKSVALWGRQHVYSAMVAGIELEPEYGLSWQEAAELAIRGAEDLCARGIIPIYSLYWPVGGRDHPDYLSHLMAYFERLNLGYREIRERYDLRIWDGFMCHRCAYMQLECDIDREIDG